MYKVQFGDYNSADDFGLTLTGLAIGTPAIKSNWLNIPARNGQIDLSGVLSSAPVFDMRTLTYTFVWKSTIDTFEAEARAIITALHGKTLNVRHNDDAYYYVGKVSVQNPTFTGRQKAQITVSLNAQPFARAVNASVVTVEPTSTEQTITVTNNGGKTVMPQFSVIGYDNVSVTLGNVTVSMNSGDHTFSNLMLAVGDNALIISGTKTAGASTSNVEISFTEEII